MPLTYYRVWMEANKDFAGGNLRERWRKNVPFVQRGIYYCAILSAVVYIVLLFCGCNLGAYIAIAVCIACLFSLMLLEKRYNLKRDTEIENARTMRLQYLIKQFDNIHIRHKKQFKYLQRIVEHSLEDRQRSKEEFQKRAFNVLIVGLGGLSINLIIGVLSDDQQTRGIGIFLLIVVCSMYLATSSIWSFSESFHTLNSERMAQFNDDLNDIILNWDTLCAKREDFPCIEEEGADLAAEAE